MSEVMDSRVCIEAEPIEIKIHPNVAAKVPELDDPKDLKSEIVTKDKFFHQINIKYERKNAAGQVLGIKTIRHDIDYVDNKDDIDTINTKVNSGLHDWTRADKIALSGVDIGAVIGGL